MSTFAERLTPENAVFTSIDHQTGLLIGVRDIGPDTLKNNIIALSRVAAILELPSVITASMPEGPNGPIMPEILAALPDATIVRRPGEINAWDSSDFRAAIEATGRRKIIMSGIVTDVCLMFPSIAAVADGYDVYAVIDASGTWDTVIQQAAMHRMTQAGVKVSTWASVNAELMHDWRAPRATELGGVMADHLSYGWVYQSYLGHPSEAAEPVETSASVAPSEKEILHA